MPLDTSHFGTRANTKAHASESRGIYDTPVRFRESGMDFMARKSLELFIDPSFTTEHKDFIQEAVGFFYSVASRFTVFESAINLSNSQQPPRGDWPGTNIQKRRYHDEGWHWFTITGTAFRANVGGRILRGNRARLYIARIWGDKSPAGKGHVGTVSRSNSPAEFTIALNSELVLNDDIYLGTVKEYWAGVIAHECLHNLGYDHPNNSDNEFINRYGDAVLIEGQGFLSLTDPEGRKADAPRLCGCTDHCE